MKPITRDDTEHGVLYYKASEVDAVLAQAAQPAPTVPDNMQDWAGMDGAIAFHLIERHADNWADTAKMMGEWLAANQAAQPAQPGWVLVQRELLDRALRPISASIFGTDTYKVSSRGDFASKVEKEIHAALQAAPDTSQKEQPE